MMSVSNTETSSCQAKVFLQFCLFRQLLPAWAWVSAAVGEVGDGAGMVSMTCWDDIEHNSDQLNTLNNDHLQPVA